MQRINVLADLTEKDGTVTRTFGSQAFIDAANQVKAWMEETGLQTRIDNIGNVRGRWKAEKENAPTLIIASHIDCC